MRIREREESGGVVGMITLSAHVIVSLPGWALCGVGGLVSWEVKRKVVVEFLSTRLILPRWPVALGRIHTAVVMEEDTLHFHCSSLNATPLRLCLGYTAISISIQGPHSRLHLQNHISEAADALLPLVAHSLASCSVLPPPPHPIPSFLSILLRPRPTSRRTCHSAT